MVRVTIRGQESEVLDVLDRMAQALHFCGEKSEILRDCNTREAKAVFYADGVYKRLNKKKGLVDVYTREVERWARH